MAKSTDVEYQPDATHWAVTDLTAHLGEELEGYMWAVLGRALWSDPERTFTAGGWACPRWQVNAHKGRT